MGRGGILYMFQERIHNLIKYKSRRRKLRNNMTDAEIALWSRIKNKQLGFKFRRQQSIGNYIVDFYCPEFKLVIEVDGRHHFWEKQKENDRIRNEYLKGLDLKILRFNNNDILKNIDGVVEKILDSIDR